MIFPWSSERGKIARVICEVYTPDKQPFEGDPRNNLIRVLDDMKKKLVLLVLTLDLNQSFSCLRWTKTVNQRQL